MPRFLFDTRSHPNGLYDQIGVELPSREAARQEDGNQRDIIADLRDGEGRRELIISVRDAIAAYLCRATLTFRGERLA